MPTTKKSKKTLTPEERQERKYVIIGALACLFAVYFVWTYIIAPRLPKRDLTIKDLTRASVSISQAAAEDVLSVWQQLGGDYSRIEDISVSGIALDGSSIEITYKSPLPEDYRIVFDTNGGDSVVAVYLSYSPADHFYDADGLHYTFDQGIFKDDNELYGAILEAEKMVKANLNYPDTAEFDQTTTSVGKFWSGEMMTYTISGEYSAANAFGMVSDGTYHVTVMSSDGDNFSAGQYITLT